MFLLNFEFRWSEAKILMVKENFFDDLIYYDKNNISDVIFEMLTKIFEFDTFRPSFVATSSKAAAGLCAWILAVYQYAKIARSQKTKLEQVKAYQELFNKVSFSTFRFARNSKISFSFSVNKFSAKNVFERRNSKKN